MKQKTEPDGAPDRLVVVRLETRADTGESFCLAFTTRQVLEVRSVVAQRPVPFADNFLLGFCAWNNRILPVIDLAARLAMAEGDNNHEIRYLVLRSGAPGQTAATLDYVVARVPAAISVMAPENSSPVEIPGNIEQQAVQGVFKVKDQILIIPDLQRILHVEHGHS